MTISRRGFTQAISAMFGAHVPDVPASTPIDDVGLLVWCIDTFGAEAVSAEIVHQVASGTLSIRSVKQSLNRSRNVSIRHAKSRERRERHRGDTVVYAGPVRLSIASEGRIVRTSHNRSVIVDTTKTVLHIDGIGIPSSDRSDSITRRSITIPAVSRILIDMRRGTHYDVWSCEVIQTPRGDTRVHLWQSAIHRSDDTVPMLSSGVRIVADTTTPPVVGLLGRPL